MKAENIYKKETGLEPYLPLGVYYYGKNMPSIEYMEWLENFVEKNNEPTILKWIKKMFDHAEKKEWFETYWTFDVHGTISIPDYRKKVKKIIYYPFAKETLQLMTKRKDIMMILWTSSYPDEAEIYKKQFEEDGIFFDFDGENPDVQSSKGSFGYYEKKHYFNALFDDKASFNPERDWKFIYDYLTNTKYKPDPNWSMKYKEEYHK